MGEIYHDGAWTGTVSRELGRVRFTWTLGGGEIAAPTLALAYARRYALDILRACEEANTSYVDNTYSEYSESLICCTCGAVVHDNYADQHSAVHAQLRQRS